MPGRDILDTGLNYVRENPISSATAALGIGAVSTAVGVKVYQSLKSRNSKKKRKSTTRKKRYSHKRKHKRRFRRTPHTAGKGKDRSTKRIRYTKNGQPYIILRSGKARFLKKSSARRSHKQKGGRY